MSLAPLRASPGTSRIGMLRTGTRAALGLGVALGLLSACTIDRQGGTTEPDPSPVASVAMTVPDGLLRIGGTILLAAAAFDAAGAAVDRPIAWASSDPSVARVDATGRVTGIAAGVTRITATSDTRQAATVVTVVYPVHAISLTAPAQVIGIGGTSQFSATVSDGVGAVVVRLVEWTTSNPAVATVSANGLVTGVGAGIATISASSEGITGSVTVTVIPVAQPVIASVTPRPMVPGETVTITGIGFSSNPAEVQVVVDGVAATLVSTTPTSITVRLGTYPCAANRDAPVVVTTLGGSAAVAHALQRALLRELAVGEAQFLESAGDARCTELPATGGTYLFNVVSTSQVPGNQASVMVRGSRDGGPAASPALARADAPPRRPGASPVTAGRRRGAAGSLEHIDRLDDLRRIVQRVGAPRLAMQQARRAQSAAGEAALRAPVPLEVGATTFLKVANVGTCAAFRSVEARVVYVGSRSVVLEATNAPLARTMDGDYAAIGAEFDAIMYDVVRANFGDPLALDAELDQNGRVVMLFTPAVNEIGDGIAGFVTACDFFPPTMDPSVAASNQAEIFYARVPTRTTGLSTDLDHREGWRRWMRSTVVHETKHIASIAARIAGNAVVAEEAWLEEGTAQVASELYGRAIYAPPGAPFRGNAGYQGTGFCEFRPLAGGCGDVPFVMFDMYAFLYSFYRAVETKSFFMSPNFELSTYGSGWLFARWAADQFAGDEAGFFRALTQERSLSGLTSVSRHAQQPASYLQTRFMLALYADDAIGEAFPAGSRITIPSWNTPDMWAGFNLDLPGYFSSAAPLQVRAVGFGTFTTPAVQLRGGGAIYVEISGTQDGRQFVEVVTGSGGPLPASSPLRLSILRVQ
ncbi:MAG: Ig-like domain-containing protein [Gemmatimonadaceae bacterium]|nr:Ig-like domain-containing protein [Gemmatimonadaceae bacterium]